MSSAQQNLPPIGLEIPCSSYATNVPLRVDVLGLALLDFKGGWKVRVEANLAAGLGGVKLKVIGLEWSADSPDLAPPGAPNQVVAALLHLPLTVTHNP